MNSQVWHLGTFQCIQTLRDHTSVVMSLLLWDQFLFSCSLDNTVKVRKVSYIYGCIFMEDKQNIFEPDWKFVPP